MRRNIKIYELLFLFILVVIMLKESFIYSNAENNGTYGSSDGFEYMILNENSIEIIGYTGNSTDINVPEELDGYTVTSIGERAFYYSDIEKVSIPYCIESIGKGSFYECVNLKDVSLQYGVVSIGEESFMGCRSIIEINIPESVIYIDDNAFRDCINLEEITIPESVISIGDYAFSNCINLEEATIPNSITSISDGLFSCDEKLIDFTIPDSVTLIGDSAFAACSSLETITIPSGVTSIGEGAFYGCSKISDLSIPNSVIVIGKEAFYECSNIEEVVIPSGVTSISDGIFSYCEGLTEIVLPDDIDTIGDYAFYSCGHIEEITIPDGVTYIGEGAFCGCGRLADFDIPESVTEIGKDAFSGCAMIEITIPDSVTIIKDGTFSGCGNLEEIHMPDGITSIGKLAFDYTKFESITIPDGVVTIGESAFNGCYRLKEVNFSDKVTSIGDYAFAHCSSLEYISIPDGVTMISESVFESCYNLTEIIIPDGVTTIEKTAFAGCSNIKSIVFPETLDFIGESAFSECIRIEEIVIPKNVSEIDDYAFSRCLSLQDIIISSGNTSIGYSCFSGCRSLETVCLPEGIARISGYSFNGCISLRAILIPESCTKIGVMVFDNCSSDLCIYGYEESFAEEYAEINNKEFIPLNVPIFGESDIDFYYNGHVYPIEAFIYVGIDDKGDCDGFSIESEVDEYTTISDEGLLTISDNELADEITISASYDGRKTYTDLKISHEDELEQYSIRFYYDDGTYDQYYIDASSGESLGFYGGPSEKDGYSCVGYTINEGTEVYYKNPKNGQKSIFDYVPTGDTNLYPYWVNTYNVIFNANGGSFSDANEYVTKVTKDEYVSNYPIPTLEGKAIKGYKIENDETIYVANNGQTLNDGEAYLDSYKIEGDTTFTAVWADAFTVTFDGNGGYYNDDSQITEYKVNVIQNGYTYEYPYPKREGYVFMGYKIGDETPVYVESNGPGVDGKTTICLYNYQITEDISFTAIWAEECTITFDANGGCYDGDNQTTEYKSYIGGKVYTYPIPMLEGKAFRGYKIENDNTIYIESYPGSRQPGEGEKYLSSYIIEGDTTFTAIWEDACTVTFNGNGGCFDGNSQTTEVKTYKGGYVTDFPIPTLEGKVLLGYMIENDDTLYVKGGYHMEEGTEKLIDYQINDDIAFTAVWAEECTITFEIDPSDGYFYEGKQTYEVQVGQGEKILNAYLEPRKFYDSTHYYEYVYRVKGTEQIYYSTYAGNISGVDYINDYVVDDDVTFVIEFARKYRVDYIGNGGKIPWGPNSTATQENITSYWYSRPYQNPAWRLSNPVPVREGFIFDGWKVTDESSFSGIVLKNLDDYVPTSDVTFEAVWRSADCDDLGHDMTAYAANEASCTEEGNSAYWSCSRCNKYFSDEEGTEEIEENSWVISALGHDYKDVDGTAVEATCTSDGREADQKCSRCGNEVQGTAISKLGHNITIHVAREATCTEAGNSAYWSCDRCNKYFSDASGETEIMENSWVIEATGHTEVIDEAVSATCTSTGLTEGKHCSVCNEVIVAQETVDALGHKATVDPAVAPTCTETGLTEGKHCSVCNEVLEAQETVAASGHKAAVDPAVAPTCTETGLTEGKHCSVCNEVLVAQETVAATGHTVVTDDAVAPTCTKTGLTEGSHCSECNTVFVAQETVAANGHSWNEGVVTKEASCSEEGVKTYTCTVCNTTYTEDIEKIAHTPVTDDAVAPSCTDTGLTVGSHCSVCNEVIVAQEEVPALDHTWDNGVVTTEPTCSSTGVKTFTCTVCHDTKKESVAKIAHTPVTDPAVEATCTTTGKTAGSHCSVCGEIVAAQQTVSVKAHTWDNVKVTKEPTCTEKGVKTYTCTKCGTTKTEDIAAKGHTEVIDPAVAATTTSTGLTEGSHCSVCGVTIKRQSVTPKLDDGKGTDDGKDTTPPGNDKNDSGSSDGNNGGSSGGNSGNNSGGSSGGGSGSGSGGSSNGSSGSGSGGSSSGGSSGGSSSGGKKSSYSSEWVDGKWYNADGSQSYPYTMSWKSNGSGWWIEDSNGWYPTSSWQKINGVWYYFKADGYMASEEWIDGWWLNGDGSCTYGGVGSWQSDGSGWWYQDSTGWYPTNTWQKIDGYWYYFKGDGYIATNQYIGGYWVGANGVCQ